MMIWNAKYTDKDDGLTSCLLSEIRQVCSETEHGISKEEQREVARSIAFRAMSEHSRAGVPTGYLALLSARALWAVGEQKAARRLLALKKGVLSFSSVCAYAVFVPDIQIKTWWHLCSMRAVSPSSLFNAKYGEIWALDMARICDSARDRLELTVFRAIAAALDALAPIWDRSQGNGVLILRRLDAVSSFLLQSKNTRRTGALASEIRKTCSSRLLRSKHTRGWANHPDVFSLDLRK